MCIYMGIYGYVWLYMDIYGYKVMYGYTWVCMVIMGIHGYVFGNLKVRLKGI